MTISKYYVRMSAVILTLLCVCTSAAWTGEFEIYPDSSVISVQWQQSGDTVHVWLFNEGQGALGGIHVTDLTDTEVTLFASNIDQQPSPPDEHGSVFGSIDPDLYTTRLCLDSFQSSAYFAYHAPGYSKGRLSVVVAEPFPMFAVMLEDSTGSCCRGMRGNINGSADEVIDIADLAYFADYYFHDGPRPTCALEADANADGSVDIGDLVTMAEYMFGGQNSIADCD